MLNETFLGFSNTVTIFPFLALRRASLTKWCAGALMDESSLLRRFFQAKEINHAEPEELIFCKTYKIIVGIFDGDERQDSHQRYGCGHWCQ